jgi:hypothetical protein
MAIPLITTSGAVLKDQKFMPMLHVIKSHYCDAVYARIQLDSAGKHMTGAEEQDRRSRFRRSIIEDLSGGRHHGDVPAELEKEATERLNAHLLESGMFPYLIENSVGITYARSFLYALDGLAKMLKVLSKTDGAPEKLVEIYEEFASHFPTLLKVRNASHHTEDMVRLKKRVRGQEQDIELEKMAGRGTIHIINGFDGNRISTTMDDGTSGHLDVTLESLVHMRDCVQAVHDCFEWHGPLSVFP